MVEKQVHKPGVDRVRIGTEHDNKREVGEGGGDSKVEPVRAMER